jgi:hypothetical protein
MNSTILSAPPQKGPRIETSLPEYGDARDVLLEVSGFTLDKWRRRGWLVPLNANYRGIAYAREDVEEFQRKHKAALYRSEPGPKTVNPRIRPRRKEASV